MNKELIKIISDIEGFVLAIGIDDKMANAVDKNDKIVKCDILNYFSKKKEKGKVKKQKTINIRNIRKIYKKKKVDYIVCNYTQIQKYLKTFVKDSIYINKTKLYYFGELDEELIIKKYKRYNTKIEIKKYKNDSIIEIDNSKAKNNILKEFIYKIVDGFNNFVEVIGDILMG